MERYQRIFKEDFKKDVLDRPLEFRYQMLGRFVHDVEAYSHNHFDRSLWSGDPITHAENMTALYNSFSKSEKPKWLSDSQFKHYIDILKKHK